MLVFLKKMRIHFFNLLHLNVEHQFHIQMYYYVHKHHLFQYMGIKLAIK